MFLQKMKAFLWKVLGWQKHKIIGNLVTALSSARLEWIITGKWYTGFIHFPFLSRTSEKQLPKAL